MIRMQASTVIPSEYFRTLSLKQTTHKRLIQEAITHFAAAQQYSSEIYLLKERIAREVF